MVILYSTGCPKCVVLKKKLESADIEYVECNDVEEMQRLGMTEVPMLSVGGEEMSFTHAVSWINDVMGG